MLALLKDAQGREKAVDIGKLGWVASPVEGNEILIQLVFDDGFSTTITLDQYDKIKQAMMRSGDLIDLTQQDMRL